MNFLFELSGETGSRLNWPSPVRISASANNGSDSECFRHGTNDTPLARLLGRNRLKDGDSPPGRLPEWRIDGSESFQKPSRHPLTKRLILWPARRTSSVFPKDLFLEWALLVEMTC
jgi:hypothetical protein